MSNKPFGSKGGGNKDDSDEDERPSSGSPPSGLFNRLGDKDKKSGDAPPSNRFNSPANSRSTGSTGKTASTPASKTGEQPRSPGSGPFASKPPFGSAKSDEENKPPSGMFNRSGSGQRDSGDKKDDKPGSSLFNRGSDRADRDKSDDDRPTGAFGRFGGSDRPDSKPADKPSGGSLFGRASDKADKFDDDEDEDTDHERPASGSLFGRFGGDKSGSKPIDKKDDKPASGSLFGRSGSDKTARPGDEKKDDRTTGTGSFPRFGGDKPGSKPIEKRDDKPASGGLFGRSGSDKATRPGDEKRDDKPASGGLFGRPGSDKPGSKPIEKRDDKPASGGLFGRPGSDKPGSKPIEKKDDKPASGGLFGRPGSDKPGSKPIEKKDDKPASGGLFGRSGSDKAATRPGDEKKDDKSAGGGLFGRFGGGSKPGDKPDDKANKKDVKKDDKPAGGGLFGRIGGAKPDEKVEKKDDKPAGGLLGRFGGGKTETPAAPPKFGSTASKPPEKKDDKPAGGGGLFNRLRGGGETKVDDKAAKPDDKSKTTSGSFQRPAVGENRTSSSSLPKIGSTTAARPDDKTTSKPFGSTTSGFQKAGTPVGKTEEKTPAQSGGGGFFNRLRGGGKSEAAAPDKKASSTALVSTDKRAAGALGDVGGVPKVAGGAKGVPPARLDKQAKPLDRSLTQVAVKRQGLSLDQKLDITGYALIASAAIIFFGLIQPDEGTLPKTVADILGGFFGYARYAMPIPLLVIGGWLLIRYFKENPFLEFDLKRISGLALMFLTFVTSLHFLELLYKVVDTMPQLEQLSAHMVDVQQGGGWVGDRLYMVLIQLTGENGIAVVLVACWIVSLYLSFEISFADVSTYIKSVASWFSRVRRGFTERRRHWVDGRMAKRQQAQAISLQKPATSGAIPAAATLTGPAAIGPAVDKKNAPATPSRTASALPAVSGAARPAPAAEAVLEREEAPLQAPVARPAPSPIGSRATASTPAPAALRANEAEAVKTGEPAADNLEGQPATPAPISPVKKVSTGLFGRGGDKPQSEKTDAEPEKVKPAPIGAPEAKTGSGLFGKVGDKAEEKEPAAEKPRTGLFGARPAVASAATPAKSGSGLFGKVDEKPDEAAPEPEKAKPGPFSAKPAALGSAPSTPAAKTGGGLFDKVDDKDAKADAAGSDVEKEKPGEKPATPGAFSPAPKPGSSLFAKAGDEAEEEAPEPASDKPAEKTSGLFGSKPAAVSSSAPLAAKPGLFAKAAETAPKPGDKTPEKETDAAPDQPADKSRFSLFGPKPASSPAVKTGGPFAKADDQVDSGASGAEKDKPAEGVRPNPFGSKPAAPAAKTGGGLFGKVGESAPEKEAQPGDAPDKSAEKLGSSLFGPKPAATGSSTPAPKTGNPFAKRDDDVTKNKPADTKVEDAQPSSPGSAVGRSGGVFGAAPKPAPKPGALQSAPVVDDDPDDADDALEYVPLDEVTVDDAELPAPTQGGSPFKPAPLARSQPAQPETPRAENPPASPGPAASLSGDNKPDGAPAPLARVNRPVQAAEPTVEGIIVRSKSGAGWSLPDFHELLEAGSQQIIQEETLRERAGIIEETLQSFGAPGKVVEINPGPVITQFGVEPDYLVGRQGKKTRVKVSSIARLDADLALALAARTIRIEAPVPGKGYVGVEVPNPETALVGLRDIMADGAFAKVKSKLRIALGKSIDGTSVVADLTQMPHLLIAGTTGSGKSVCVNAIISCLLLENAPDDLQLIMIDPKRVELTGYNGIPHLVSPVVVDLERIVGVLKWVTREMDERYKRFSAAGARNITDFNGRLKETEKKMPYLVVVVDELADLMMLAPDETEKVLTRLAQMARATGIHLIISTQRPSVDVVTGLIKANFPSRISFAVASSVDSRVILDQPGAEKLLGRGDMLYQAPDAAAPSRVQGVYVSDMEINRITRYWKEAQLNQRESKPAPVLSVSSFDASDKPSGKNGGELPQGRTERLGPIAISGSSANSSQKAFFDAIREPEPGKGDGEGGEDDEMYTEAVALFKKTNKVSISLLQRRLRIGFTRAARLIDLMKQRGVLGASDISTLDNDDES